MHRRAREIQAALATLKLRAKISVAGNTRTEAKMHCVTSSFLVICVRLQYTKNSTSFQSPYPQILTNIGIGEYGAARSSMKVGQS
jgi:hypothetical protein